MESIENTFEYDRVLVYGIGGSGDIVGSIPTARLLEQHGVEVIIGGIAWERLVADPKPGPRSFDEIEALDEISHTVGLVTESTATTSGVEFTETQVARQVDNEVVLLDITKGVSGLVSGLQTASQELDIDAVFGTDSGGDALAVGNEPGLRSPLADGLATATLCQLDQPTCIGIFGYGSDGELTTEEINTRLASIAKADGLLGAWGLSRQTVKEMAAILEVVDTEASRLPVEAARGEMGTREIRGGDRDLELQPASTVTFYVNPDTIAAQSEIPAHLFETADIEEAEQALIDAGYHTELTAAKERAEHEQ